MLLHDQARQSRLASKGTHRPWTCRDQRRSHLHSCRLLECTGKPLVSCRAWWATRPLLAEMGGLGAIKTPTSQFRRKKSRSVQKSVVHVGEVEYTPDPPLREPHVKSLEPTFLCQVAKR